MSLSLQVKKFINSEHTGEYVEILLPLSGTGTGSEKRSSRKGKAPFGGAEPDGSEVREGESQPAEELPQDVENAGGGAQAKTEAAAETVAEGETETVQFPVRGAQFETVKLHYFEEGSGEPLILVHTVGQSLYTWRKVFARLAEHYRVIALDLPGHGYSDRPVNFGYTIEEFANALGLFMDALDIESAHFVGFSMGSAYVMQLAAEHPERCGRLMLLAPGSVVNEMPLSIRMLDSSIFGGLASILYSRKTVAKILEECFFDLTNVNDDMIDEYYRPASDPDARRAIRFSLHYFEDENLILRLREVDKPVLILQGSEDKWRSEELAATLHAALPEAGYSVVRNTGHLMHEEKPDKLISAVLEFIPVIMPEA